MPNFPTLLAKSANWLQINLKVSLNTHFSSLFKFSCLFLVVLDESLVEFENLKDDFWVSMLAENELEKCTEVK